MENYNHDIIINNFLHERNHQPGVAMLNSVLQHKKCIQMATASLLRRPGTIFSTPRPAYLVNNYTVHLTVLKAMNKKYPGIYIYVDIVEKYLNLPITC